MNSKQHRHHPRPPPVLIHFTIIAPSPEPGRGPYSRPLGWPLTPEQFLKVGPFPLCQCKQSSDRLCPEVPDDDTKFRNKKWRSQVDEYVSAMRKGDSPNEEREDDDDTKHVINDEKNGVDLR
jgi:hypothetical protein